MTLIPHEKQTQAVSAPATPALDMNELFQAALAKGQEGVGALEKLVGLHEQMQRRGAELQFSLALAAFQSECPPVQRSSTATIAPRGGSGYSYTYADLEEIITHVRPHLIKHGFSFTFDSETDGKMFKAICTLRHEHGHSMTSSFKVTTDSPSGATEQQKVGGAQTYAKRQCLINVLGLALTEPEEAAGLGKPVAKITEEQAATLGALIDETNTAAAGFLQRFKIASLADLPANLYNEGVRVLEARRKVAKA